VIVPRLNFNSYLENEDYYPALKEENLFEKPAETSRNQPSLFSGYVARIYTLSERQQLSRIVDRPIAT